MRIIDKVHKKIKEIGVISWIDEAMWIAIIMFVGLGSFSLGILYERQNNKERNPITIEYNQEAVALWQEYQSIKSENQSFFASKNGSVVYPVGCSRGNTINEENKIFFDDINDAFALGYREASGC